MANYISTHTGAEIDAAVDRIGDISLVKCTQSEYDAMISHDANTLYIVVPDSEVGE